MDLTGLQFDTIFKVDLPDNGLSAEGRQQIFDYLEQVTGLPVRELKDRLPEDWSWNWKVTRGTYAGTLPKRVGNWLFKAFMLKLTPSQMSQIGNICALNTTKANTFWFDFNRTIDWKLGDFGDQKSCFLTGNKPYAIPLIKGFGGFALRLWSGDGPVRKGLGRGWLLPFIAPNGGYYPDRWLTPDGLILFNGYGLFKEEYMNHSEWEGEKKTYGQLQTLDYARLLAQHLGATYQRVRFSINESYDNPLWINNHGLSAVLIGPPEVTAVYKKKPKDEDYKELDLRWPSVAINTVIGVCSYCGNGLQGRGKDGLDGHRYCHRCYEKFYGKCLECATVLDRRKSHAISLLMTRRTEYLCNDHFYARTFTCSFCQERYHLIDRFYYYELSNDPHQYPTQRSTICRQCFESRIVTCPTCDRHYPFAQLNVGALVGPCNVCREQGLQIENPIEPPVEALLEPGDNFTVKVVLGVNPTAEEQLEMILDDRFHLHINDVTILDFTDDRHTHIRVYAVQVN